ncbi:ATP-dependent helicase [Trichothermofontia sichuanensis]|uniref:ATP-dependent helicase n=1 Tax=Trichothermofontia sichuanensis TaxID=3045816 RepID=UPI00249DEDAE|nr:ATP-dependent helicase [Trichothermofontia sichuanensis]
MMLSLDSFATPAANHPEHAIQSLRAKLRRGQQAMADWQGGPLAVSAVPGAGKSTGMAGAAAIAIARHQLHLRRQLVLVTFTRSAAASLKSKVRSALQELGLPPLGFSVHTLHGLALNIATRYPELSGLDLDNVAIVSPNQSHRLIRIAVDQWIATAPRLYQRLLEGVQFDSEEAERLRRQSVLRTQVLPELAKTVIHEAKSSGLQPEDLRQLSEAVPDEYATLAIAAGLYEQYQALLRARNFIDYDEMILAALRVLTDATARQTWQEQTFAVFEDEAQDSTPLQTCLLEILATDPQHPEQPPNLVRVGDPNQAINSTFTPADPIFFRTFCDRCTATGQLVTMDEAGRSTPIIIEAANFTLNWVNEQCRQRLRQTSAATGMAPLLTTMALPFRPQTIRPVPSGDVQPNPPPTGQGLELYQPQDIYQTVDWIGERALALLREHPDHSAAVLVRENRQGQFVAQRLQDRFKQAGIEIYEVGEQERHSHVPSEMLALLQFLDRPHSPDRLKAALSVLVSRQRIPAQDLDALASLPEQFLYPTPLDPPQPEPVQRARRYGVSLLRARLELPSYQLISFLALSLGYDQTELATADKLVSRVLQQTQGDSSLAAMITVLSEITNSERFEPVETDEAESRYARAGRLTIITMHKAKGLDWDYVFLPFLHDTVIPGNPWVPLQAQFLGEFTLAEVARAQIRADLHAQLDTPVDNPAAVAGAVSPLASPAIAWQQANELKLAEEYRLLYVAMTRARRLLWMSAARQGPFSWNQLGKLGDRTPCPVLPALRRRFPQSCF